MRTSRRPRREAGVSLTLLAVVVLIVVSAIVAVTILGRRASEGQRSEDTRLKFERASEALTSFVSLNQRLPCPADPTLDDADANSGVSSPDAPTLACSAAAATGTLPWKTIGMRREDAYDAWGWRISYRVYTGGAGNVGSLTQDRGASAIDCDTVDALPGPAVAGLCSQYFDTPPSVFLVGKGFTVNDFGTVHTPSSAGDGAAFVLISHGPSGLGAYTSAGKLTALPTSADEQSNRAAVPASFVAKAANVRDMSPYNANYFDDMLAYTTLGVLVKAANVDARDWPDPPVTYASVRLDSATLTAALGTAPALDLGRTNVRFTNARVTALVGGTNQDLTFDTVGGVEGIGGGAGSTTLSSADNESVKIEFAQVAQKLALTIDRFGCRTFFGFCIDVDRVELRFYKAGVELGGGLSPQTKNACRSGTGLASFSIDLGVSPAADFDRVDIKPLASAGFPGGAPTAFLISEFKTCAAGSACVTSLDTGPALSATTGGNRC